MSCKFSAAFAVLLSALSLDASIFVSTNGSDAKGDGSKTKPFATLERALKSFPAGGREIVFENGVYVFDKTCRIEKIDGGKDALVIRENGDNVEFVGGARIGAENLREVSEKSILDRLRKPSGGKLFSLDLKKFGIADFGQMRQRGFSVKITPMQMEAFYSHSRKLHLAKYPNEGMLPIGKVLDKGFVPAKEPKWRKPEDDNKTVRGATFISAHPLPDYWAKHDDIWLDGVFSVGWADDHQRVKSADPKTGKIVLAFPHKYGVMSSLKEQGGSAQDISARGYVAYNMLEEIDEPLEYYIDRKNGVFYVMLDAAPPKGAYFDFSMLETPLILIDNSQNISIENIKFKCGRDSGVIVRDSQKIAVKNCEISNFGLTGIVFTRNNGAPKTSYTLSGCAVFDCGNGGASMGGGDRKTLVSGENLVFDCVFDRNCRIKKNYAAGLSISGVGTVADRCDFSDGEHQLLSFGGNDHTIKRCKFSDACRRASDMGAIYTGRNPSNKGISIINNFFTDIFAFDKRSKNAAVYIDDGSGGMEIRANIFCRCGTAGSSDMFAAIFFNGGDSNNVEKNVFIECEASLSQGSWDDKRFEKTFFDEYLYRLKTEVDIESEPYKKYPQLKNFFVKGRPRFNTMTGCLFYKTPPPYNGDIRLKNRHCKLVPSTEPKDVKSWTPELVSKYFGENAVVAATLKDGIGAKRKMPALPTSAD